MQAKPLISDHHCYQIRWSPTGGGRLQEIIVTYTQYVTGKFRKTGLSLMRGGHIQEVTVTVFDWEL